MGYCFSANRQSLSMGIKWRSFLLGGCVFNLFVLCTPTQAATTIGATPGSHQVTPSGAFTYSIPIAVPPGTAGIEPKLSLAYNSQGGNGLLGMGWSLGGLSFIHRCPKTYAQDGQLGGVNYDANDRYCLDGQRLVAINGPYGTDSTEYRTESESYSRVISYGSQGSGPSYWKVWTKSGQVIEYGNTADSRIEAQGKTEVMLWSLNKLSDTVSNTLTVSYAEDNPNGQFYPDRIDYTGNANAGKSPINSVRFVYETRPDNTPTYHAGSLNRTTVRMKNVQTYSGATLSRDYRVAYEQSSATQRSRLISLTECEGGGGCLKPIIVNWVATPGGWQEAPNYKMPTHIAADGHGDLGTRFVDLNGDGLQDFVYSRWINGTMHVASWLNTNLHVSAFTFTTGLNATATVTYKPLTDATVYTKDSTAVYPAVDIQAPIYVVSSVATSDGVGGSHATDYTYAGAKSHQLGGGFLGFRQTTVRDRQSGIRSVTNYRQTYPYHGAPLSSERRASNNTLLGQSLITYTDQLLNTALSPVWRQSLPTRTVESSYELTGSLISTVTTDTQYDAWGNPMSIVVDSGGGYSKTTTNLYDNITDANRWFLGRLRRSTVNSVTP